MKLRRLMKGAIAARAVYLACVCSAIGESPIALDRIVVTEDRKAFIKANSREPFVPWGVNYGNHGRLMEDFWKEDWGTLSGDFNEVKQMGGNVIRVHLQFGRFMKDPRHPNEEAIARLGKLLKLAEENGIYLDITGLACYRPGDTPAWYDSLSDSERWEAQSAFWRAVAESCALSPAVFCYDLMNEPVSPGAKTDKWYSGALLGGYDFIQNIRRDPTGASRNEIAVEWTRKMTAAIRKKDSSHLITVGMLPWVTDWKHLSGFIPAEVAPEVDFLSVHIYPKTTYPEEAPRALQECNVGKPVVIEETFPLTCSVPELEAFLRSSRSIASGWIWHYDGITLEEYGALEKDRKLTVAQTIWRDALRAFIRLRPEFLPIQIKHP